MTLDESSDNFQRNQTMRNAHKYLETAFDYWKNEMIEDGTMCSILEEFFFFYNTGRRAK
jgi:hypothetical protein